MKVKVYEMLEQLRKMPPNADLKIQVGEHVVDPERVEYEEERQYVIVRTEE